MTPLLAAARVLITPEPLSMSARGCALTYADRHASQPMSHATQAPSALAAAGCGFSGPAVGDGRAALNLHAWSAVNGFTVDVGIIVVTFEHS